MTTLPPRFDKLIDKSGPNGCWVWIGSRYPAGYGKVHWEKKKRLAHRVVYTLMRGPIPEGLVIDHLCRVRACVNPDHLEPVTYRENILRGESAAAVNARKTHCKRGHELGGDNVTPGNAAEGVRDCRECGRITSAAYQADLRAQRKAAKAGHSTLEA